VELLAELMQSKGKVNEREALDQRAAELKQWVEGRR
jgi:hypothetical protein